MSTAFKISERFLSRWFKKLNNHYGTRGKSYYMYKPVGKCRTLGRTSEEALKILKSGLQDPGTTFIYHCWNHYFCPVGFEDVPKKAEDAYRWVVNQKCWNVNEMFERGFVKSQSYDADLPHQKGAGWSWWLLFKTKNWCLLHCAYKTKLIPSLLPSQNPYPHIQPFTLPQSHYNKQCSVSIPLNINTM